MSVSERRQTEKETMGRLQKREKVCMREKVCVRERVCVREIWKKGLQEKKVKKAYQFNDDTFVPILNFITE